MKFRSRNIQYTLIGASSLFTIALVFFLYTMVMTPVWAFVSLGATLVIAAAILNRLKYVLKKQIIDSALWMLSGIVVFIIIGSVVAVIVSLIAGGGSMLSWEFLTEYPRNGFREGGIFPAIVGTALLVILMSIICVPIGTITAIYLTEFARESSFIARLIRFAVNTLAGVPAIVFGLFGLGFFIGTVGMRVDAYTAGQRYDACEQILRQEQSPVSGNRSAKPGDIAGYLLQEGGKSYEGAAARLRSLALSNESLTLSAEKAVTFLESTERPSWGQPSLFWAALTMALLTLPVVIISVEEAIRAVPRELREASYALGGNRMETIFRVVLPSSISGILTGTILAVSRGAGEVAPILFTGAAYYMPDLPVALNSQFMELGYHIYVLTTQSTNAELTRPLQFATTLVLLLLTFTLNLSAIILRSRIRARTTKYA